MFFTRLHLEGGMEYKQKMTTPLSNRTTFLHDMGRAARHVPYQRVRFIHFVQGFYLLVNSSFQCIYVIYHVTCRYYNTQETMAK